MRRPSVRAPQPVLELPPCADRLGQGFWEAQLGWRQSRSPHLAMDRLAVTWRGHWSRDSLRRLEKPVLESRRDHSTCLARPVAAGLQSLPGRAHEAGGSGRSNLERLRRTSGQDGSNGRAQPRNSDSARGTSRGGWAGARGLGAVRASSPSVIVLQIPAGACCLARDGTVNRVRSWIGD